MNSSIESSCDLNAGFYEAVEYETNEVSELCLENYYLSASTDSSSDEQPTQFTRKDTSVNGAKKNSLKAIGKRILQKLKSKRDKEMQQTRPQPQQVSVASQIFNKQTASHQVNFNSKQFALVGDIFCEYI